MERAVTPSHGNRADPQPGPAVLITGASTGIGRATVDRLAAAGWRVYASVRRQADADVLAGAHGARVTPLVFDVTDLSAVQAAGQRIVMECGAAGLRGLVNNAGMAVAGPLEFLPPAELRHQLDVNVVGQVAVTQAVLPALRQARGRVVMIGSIAGLSALPFTGAYSASKFALEAITDAWRIELHPWGIELVMIEPGAIATPIWEPGTRYALDIMDKLPPQVTEYYGAPLDGMRRRAARGIEGLPPDEVAKVVERARTARRPRPRYLSSAA
ncbi:MAG: SDR family NAD(P)-dependent oxidoreductase, partial [Gemmatimonadetes bacterium]|nr:SDR family NAD(P)-dependent oxidoreductase [Gemmatimonadota bacterium]